MSLKFLMLSEQVLNASNKYKKCYKLCDNKVLVNATEERNCYNCSNWDYANSPTHVLSVMSVPSPNGSTSSIISSEDSSSTASSFSTRQSIYQYSHQQQPQPSTSSSSSSTLSSLLLASNSKQLKLCRVCGDRAKSYHFGGISCDSCKAFFRRSVQNDANRNFHCPYDGQCEITITSRKSCQYCRFNKCILIGMEKSWVMTEEERMQMLKQRMEKRKQEEECSFGKIVIKSDQSSDTFKYNYKPDISKINKYLTEEEVKLIETIMNLYVDSIMEISMKPKCDTKSKPSRTEILNIFFTAIQQFALFAQRLECFISISLKDQQMLLSGGVLEMCFLRGAFMYDINGKCWPYADDCSGLFYSEHLEIMVTKGLLEKHMHFIKTMKKLQLDETTNILLILIVLLSPDREGLTDSELVQKEQEKYLLILKSFMSWRYGSNVSSILYPKLLLKLTDLRELAEAHTDYHLLLCKEELDEIQQRLTTLHIGINSGNTYKPVTSSGLMITLPATPWTIRKSLLKECATISNICADDELSTSSEGSEKLLSSD